MPVVAGAVLAAGSGTRMGQPKADLVVGGVRLVDRAVAVLRAGGCDPVIAVVREGTRLIGANVVVNNDPDRGMRSSLELAVDAAGAADAILVLLVDMPGIDADAVKAVLAAWRPGRIAVGRYPGARRGHPVAMDRALWREAIDLAPPDEGGRVLMYVKRHLIDEVPVAGDATDLDTPDDLTRWSAP